MPLESCLCPKCLAGSRTQLPLIEVDELTDHDLYFGRYYQWLTKVSPPTNKASIHASGVGVFCNGSSAAPNKGSFINRKV